MADLETRVEDGVLWLTLNRPEVFNALSIAFPVPGEQTSAQLGLPDVLFFSLFLAATIRFALRPRLTWTLMPLSFGATLALTVWTDVAGLPALPILSAAFVAAGFAAPSLHALVGPAASAAPSRVSGSINVDAAHVSLIQNMTRNFATLDNQHGAGRVRRVAVAYLDGEVSPLLNQGRFDASVGRSLLRAAAELARVLA